MERGVNVTSNDLGELISKLNFDETGIIDVKQLYILIERCLNNEDVRKKASEVFREFDPHNKGYYDANELKSILMHEGTPMNEKEYLEIMEGLEMDSRGQFDYNRFLLKVMEQF